MNVLIRGMEMPSGCFACPLVSGYMLFREYKREPCANAGLCRLNRKIEVQIDGRPQDCPLIPAADVRPVVRGRDICDTVDGHCEFKCSVCGVELSSVYGGNNDFGLDGGYFNFCPNCGAKMDGGRVMVKEDCINYYPPGRDDEYCMVKDDVFLHCDGCEKYKSKYTKTNADRIRSMTDEELAKWMAGRKEACPPRKEYKCSKMTCTECWLDWMQEEVK